MVNYSNAIMKRRNNIMILVIFDKYMSKKDKGV